MATISDADVAYIEDHPFSSLELKSLQATLKTHNEDTSSASSNKVINLSASRNAISKLLAILQVHPVAESLRSASQRPLDSQLALLNYRLRSDDLSLSLFDPLTTAVADHTSDLDIWKAVLQLIDNQTRITPPPSKSIPPSYGGTPFVCSSASHRGTDQTRRDLEQPLRKELAKSTFVDVGGFHDKYFKDKRWCSKASEIYHNLCEDNGGDPLKGFPGMHSEDKIWAWLDDFQNKCLTDSLGKYFRTTKKGQTTTEAERQLDLFIKPRDTPKKEKHDMRDVRVVGELTSSKKQSRWLPKYIQLAIYIRDVFADQPTRRFVHAFLLFDTQMELWVFDRSGAYSSDTFDIFEQPERFIQVMAGYALMTDEELGLDTFLQRDAESAMITISDAGTGKDRILKLQSSPFVRQRSIVSRGTTCYRTTDEERVVKFSWRAAERQAESEHLRAARNVPGVATLEGSRDIISIKELRRGLKFSESMRREIPLADSVGSGSASKSFASEPSQLESLGLSGTKRRSNGGEEPSSKKLRSSSFRNEAALKDVALSQASFAPPADLFKDRTFTCLAISPAGRPLRDFRSPSEFLVGMRDAIRAHKALFIGGRRLHRDISEHNIILTDPKKNDGCSGMLIDLELAVAVGADGKNEQTGARHMTGTLDFMALEILKGGLDPQTSGIEHTYRHDLESFFYVFLSICIRCGREAEKAPKYNPLSRWYTGTIEDIYVSKSGHMNPGVFEDTILREFSPTFRCFIDLARKLREILFSAGALDIGTREDPEELYGPIIEAFDDAIQALSW